MKILFFGFFFLINCFLFLGSATLRQWQQLATPHLGGVFESRPGVKILFFFINCFLFLGSATLRQWQQLATPHLGGIFESRPGVKIKGEKKLDIAPEVYSLSDYEEDGESVF